MWRLPVEYCACGWMRCADAGVGAVSATGASARIHLERGRADAHGVCGVLQDASELPSERAGWSWFRFAVTAMGATGLQAAAAAEIRVDANALVKAVVRERRLVL